MTSLSLSLSVCLSLSLLISISNKLILPHLSFVIFLEDDVAIPLALAAAEEESFLLHERKRKRIERSLCHPPHPTLHTLQHDDERIDLEEREEDGNEEGEEEEEGEGEGEDGNDRMDECVDGDEQFD